MARWIALFRGINVGKAKRIAMAELRTLLETELGHSEVSTLLNSGNVVFSATGRPTAIKLAAAIETAIDQHLGVQSKTTVISGAQLDAMLAAMPWDDADEIASRLLVAVLREPDSEATIAALKQLGEKDWAPDGFAIGPGVAYLRCEPGILDSKLAPAFEKLFKDRATSRNWATMKKLQALANG